MMSKFKVGDMVTPKQEHRRAVVEHYDRHWKGDGRVLFNVHAVEVWNSGVRIGHDGIAGPYWPASYFTLANESLTPGDIVEVTTDQWGAHQQGRVGEVVDVNPARNLPISVEFENKEINLYHASDLELVSVPTFEVGDRVIIVNDEDFRDEVEVGDEAIVWEVYGDDCYQIIVCNNRYETYLQFAEAKHLASA